MSTDGRMEIETARCFAHPAERVFDAWLDVGSARRWMFATPDGVRTHVEIDPRVGGGFTVIERRGDEDAFHTGEYLEIDRPNRLVFTFAVEENAAETDRVAVRFLPMDTGCEVTIVHDIGVEWAAYADRVREGWAGMLAGLDASLG